MVISYSWFTTKGLRVVGLPRWAQGGDIPIAIRHQAMHEVSGLRAVRQGHVLHQAGPWIHRREQTGHGWRCAEHPNRKDSFEKYRLRCPQAHTWTIERTRQQVYQMHPAEIEILYSHPAQGHIWLVHQSTTPGQRPASFGHKPGNLHKKPRQYSL